MSHDWDIKPCGGSCAECQTPFADRQFFMAELVHGEEGYQRLDYCGACWEKLGKQELSSLSKWKGVFKAAAPPAPEVLKKETAESLLRNFMQDEDESQINAMYVLAIMLDRKRILVERDTKQREDGTTVIVYEHKKTGEVFVVPEPHLDLNALGTVQDEVAALLGGAGPRDESAADTQPSESSEAGEGAPADAVAGAPNVADADDEEDQAEEDEDEYDDED